MQNLKILIVGGSGFIGSKLCELLVKKGYEVIIADLRPPREIGNKVSFIELDASKNDISPDLLSECHAVVNLAGATIGKRWNNEYKKIIYESRIITTRKVVKAISLAKNKPKVLVNASASGYYGNQNNEILNEDHTPGNNFLANVCIDWEAEAQKANDSSVRVVIVRTAHVLGFGGLLSSLLPMFKKGLGGYFGSGKQYMPWIHWSDVVGIYIFAIENNISGAFNVGAGKTIFQKDIFKAFAKSIGVRIVWRIPYIFAKIFLGEFAESLMDSQNTDSTKIKKVGYVYNFEDITLALKDIYSKTTTQ